MMHLVAPKAQRATGVVGLSLLLWHCSGPLSKSKSDDSSGDKPTSTSESTTSTADNETEFTPTDNDSAAPPAQVTGSYLTNLSCIVTNQSDTEASDTAVTCKLSDKRGEKFAGKLADVAVKIVVSSSTTEVSGSVSILDSAAADSFVVVFSGVSPQDALGIEMTALLDGKLVSLQSILAVGGATTTISDMDLYVSQGASAQNNACTKEAPCSSIRRSLLFVPDLIGHKVNIHVATGNYAESIKVSGKTVKSGGALILKGQSSNWEDTDAMVHLSGDYTRTVDDPILGLSGNKGTELRIQNFEVESCSAFGFLVYGSAATITKVRVVECKSFPADSALVRPVGFSGLMVDEGSEVQIREGSFVIGDFSFPVYAHPAAECLLNPGPANGACRRMQINGIVVRNGSSLVVTKAEIDIQASVDVGIFVVGSNVVTRASYPTRITLKKVIRGIALYDGASFRDSDLTAYPTAVNRLSLSFLSGDYPIWVENSEYSAEFSDLNLAFCKKGCLYAKGGGSITLGIDALSPVSIAYTVPLNVRMNTVPSVPSAAEGFVGFADHGSHITFLSSIEELSLCHTSTVAEPIFRAGFGGSLDLRIKKPVLATVSAACVDNELGKVAVDIGTVAISSAQSKQTICANDVSFKTCLVAEIAN